MHMYVVYCQNKPRSEYIVAEYETYFEVSTAQCTLLLLTALSPGQGDCSVTCGVCLKQTPEDFDTAHGAEVSAVRRRCNYLTAFKFSYCEFLINI